MPDLRNRPVLVVRHHIDNHRNARRTIPLVSHLFISCGAGLVAGTLFDGPVDVVLGHVLFLCRQDGLPQSGVPLNIAAAQSGCKCDFLDQFREDLAAFRIDGALLSLDRTPFGMP